MRGRPAWYLVPRSLRRWQWRLIGVAGLLFALGLGFISGWALVRLPSQTDDAGRPAPSWLLWTGVLICLGALVVIAIAKLTAPIYDPDIPSDDLTTIGPVAEFVLFGGCVCLGLIICTLASESSSRWRPLALAVIMVVVVPITLSNRS